MALQELLKIPTVRGFLVASEILDRLERVLVERHFEASRAEELLDLTDAVLDDQLPLDQMPALLAQAFGVDEKVAKELAADIAGYRLYPLRDFVEGVPEHIVKWGKWVEDYPQKRVGKARITADRLAGDLAEKHALEFSDVLIKRMGFLIKAYFDGSKTRESTLTFFSRPPSIGGLGIGGDKGQEVLADVDEMRSGLEIVDREEDVHEKEEVNVNKEEMLQIPHPEEGNPDEGPLDALNTETGLEISPSHEVAAEVPVVSGKVVRASQEMVPVPEPDDAKAAKRVEVVAASARGKLEDAVTLSVDAVAAILQSKRISKKAFADIARAAIRGVRDLYQTRELFQRDFGVADADLEVLTEAVEQGHAAYNVKEAKEIVQPVVSSSDVFQVSAARTKAEEVQVQQAKITPEERDRAEMATRPTPITAKLTVGSVPPARPGQQSVVTDIRSTTKLMGPVDQLGTMSPTEFRRLSTSPSDAVQKVEDLMLSLERQSYEERIRGVKAWRQSPINQLYLGMAAQALKDGVAIAEVASRRRAAGNESLSPAEIRAISVLNAKLRF